MKIFTREQIESVVDILALISALEEGLVLHSQKKVVTSPVGFLHFDHPVGDIHIKSAGIIDNAYYVVKIASGFYDNPKKGLESSNGVMLLFCQKTGSLKAVLLDEGKLTDLRTALSGAICAKYLAPKNVNYIGIIGTGTQAKMQLLYLKYISSCREVLLWGRSQKKALEFAKDPDIVDFNIRVVDSIDELASKSRLIVTTTPSKKPLLFARQVKSGTHITAIGADGKGKQEIDKSLLLLANTVVVDSLEQSLAYGDLFYAKDEIDMNKLLELGAVIDQQYKRGERDITIADLTGIAVEDLQIAQFVYHQLSNEGS